MPKSFCFETCSVVGTRDRLREERLALWLKQDEFAQLGCVNRTRRVAMKKESETRIRLTLLLLNTYRAISDGEKAAIDRIIGAMAQLTTKEK